MLSKLRAETIALRDGVKRDTVTLGNARQERHGLENALDQVLVECEAIDDELLTETEVSRKLQGVPTKLKERSAVLEDAARVLRARDVSLRARVESLSKDMETQGGEIDKLTQTHSLCSANLEKTRFENEQKERSIDENATRLEHESFKADALLETSAVVTIDLAGAENERVSVLKTLKLELRQKDLVLKRTKRAQLASNAIREETKLLKETEREKTLTLTSLRKECEELEEEMTSRKRLLDDEMDVFLSRESTQLSAKNQVRTTRDEVTALTRKAKKRKDDAVRRASLLRDAERAVSVAERDRITVHTELKRQKELVMVRKSGKRDAERRYEDVTNRLAQQRDLKLLAEEQRARLCAFAANSTNAAADLRDQLQTLAEEIVGLRKDEEDKEFDLETARKTHRDAVVDAAAKRHDLNRNLEHKRAVLEKRDQTSSELLRVQNHVRNAKKALATLKKQVLGVTTDRDVIGNALLVRDDELVSLYEKAATQGKVLAAGEIELAKRTGEVGTLELALSECVRKSSVANATASAVPALDEQVTLLRRELVNEKCKLESLETRAEDPSDPRR
jgi:DNA repair exonuclease SbcCD ATPase subunit